MESFNSLYWDFLSESSRQLKGLERELIAFQFPLLGFSFWIARRLRLGCSPRLYFQFPLLGFSFWIKVAFENERKRRMELSIPFIGIFFLNPMILTSCPLVPVNSFNSLYWDFLSESWFIHSMFHEDFGSFNSLYWDFLSESPFEDIFSSFSFGLSFNSLYWDFLSESSQRKEEVTYPSWWTFNSLYWDFLSESFQNHF